jgi:nitrite reductase (NADH) small subunit
VGVTADREAGARIHVGPLEELPLDEFRIIQVPGGSIGVVRTEVGVYAVRNRCPHMGAEICTRGADNTMLPSRPFEYEVGHEHLIVRCPWHRWEFRIDSGESIGHITSKRLITYEVELDGGEVYVVRRSKRRAEAAAAAAATGGDE